MSAFNYSGSTGLPITNERHNPFLPPRPSFSFPILKSDEISKCLAELGVSVSLEELQHPEKYKDSVRRLLEALAEICTGCSREDIQQPSFTGLQQLSFPELHDDSVVHMNLFRACCNMMEVCEIPDFSIKDIMSPTASRLRRHLSGIINFAKFREERLLLLSELRSKREILLCKLESTKERSNTLHTRLALLREQTQEESKTITDTEFDCQSIASEINEIKNEEQKLRGELDALRSSSLQIESDLNVKQQTNAELKEQRSFLSSQIVSSPEKFRHQIMEVGQSLQTEQKDAKMAEKKVKELSAWLVNVEESHVELNSALEAIYELRTEVERQKSLKGDLDAQAASTSSERNVLSEMHQQLRQTQRTQLRSQEKLKQLRQQMQIRSVDNKKSIEVLHQQLIDAESMRMQIVSGVERHENEATRLEAELSSESSLQEQEIRDISSAYQRSEAVIIQHLKHLQKCLQNDSSLPDESVHFYNRNNRTSVKNTNKIHLDELQDENCVDPSATNLVAVDNYSSCGNVI